jgi:hypothetical protein
MCRGEAHESKASKGLIVPKDELYARLEQGTLISVNEYRGITPTLNLS